MEDVFNAIQVTGDSIGDVMFYGRGAGKLPTASAVVADIMDIVKSKGNKKPLSWGPGGEDTVYSPADLTSRWYFRVAGDFFADGATRLRNGDANDGESVHLQRGYDHRPDPGSAEGAGCEGTVSGAGLRQSPGSDIN